jgi:Cof subfamily protein (haloacid dehalogenase superfamily)
MAAMDLDGTLLGPDGQISSANMDAVQRLQNAGLHVVLASGRHYKNMRRFADQLPGVQWLISCQGGELCDVNRTTILTAKFLPSARVRENFDLGASLGFSTIAYAVDGVFTDSDWNPDLEIYAGLSGSRPLRCHARELFDRQIFKLIWMGSPSDIERTLQQGLFNTAVVQAMRTHTRFLEFMPMGVSKASALEIIARRLGVNPSESIAFGDGDNDVPMFGWAGVSVAMAHGWPAALRKATYTTADGPAETALARAIDLLFDNNLVMAAGESPECVAAPHAA